MKRTLLAALALLSFTGTAGASGLYIAAGSSDISFTGYDTPPATVTGDYSNGTLGTLMTDTAGTVTATYLGDESGYDNFYQFFWPTVSTLNESAPVGSSISTTVNAGEVIPFMYKDDQGVSVTNGVPFVTGNYATFAMLYRTTATGGGKDYTNTNIYGLFDYVIGFNDSATVDADYDDFVVGLKFAPSPVPLPAAAWLFGSALFGFIAVSNRRKV